MGLWRVFQTTVMITAFVAVMMILVEYVNILTRGSWQRALRGSLWKQYMVASLLGATPGCLGAFVVVALYGHRVLTMGAVVAAMIATSGDEAFVMLALFPKRAILLTLGLVGIGIVAGLVTDLLGGKSLAKEECEGLVLHNEDICGCFPRGAIVRQLRRPSLARGILVGGTGIFILAVIAGQLGPTSWTWVRVTLVGVGSLALFVVATVPDHFLEGHIWRHVALQHVPRIFLWTLGAMAVLALLTRGVHAASFVKDNRWLVMVLAAAVGIIPESGPHLVFVTLYGGGFVPFSTLVTSSIVQDGHGMLPLLALSRSAFIKIKGINILVGLMVGATMMLLGW